MTTLADRRTRPVWIEDIPLKPRVARTVPVGLSVPGDALLAGASGLVGSALAASWEGPGTLHLLVRRPVSARAGQSVQVVDFSALPALPPAETAFCCLGTTMSQAGSHSAFRAVDQVAVLDFARAARAAGVKRFVVVSSMGANPRSTNLYSRVKGDMEAALRAVGFETLVIVRPSLLLGSREGLGQPPRPGERLAQALARPLSPILPRWWRPISPTTVARAMLRAASDTEPESVRVISSGELQKLGA